MAEPLTVLDEAPQVIRSTPHGSQVGELLAVYTSSTPPPQAAQVSLHPDNSRAVLAATSFADNA
jgi:hypothetical protein